LAACNVDNPMPLTYKTNGDDLGMVNIQKTMERSTNFHGKTHYFNGHFP